MSKQLIKMLKTMKQTNPTWWRSLGEVLSFFGGSRHTQFAD